jgi:uncharacterized protein YjbI with pentapeptide repeats
MANSEHLDILKQGVETWNQWRREHLDIQPDLSSADLSEMLFRGVNFSGANLRNANLRDVKLSRADLNRANLSRAYLSWANLNMSNLSGADLRQSFLLGVHCSEADLSGANLGGAFLNNANFSSTNLTNTNLSGAHLEGATLSGTNLSRADLAGCHIHGISAWNIQLEETIQSGLIITRSNEPIMTIDNLKVAQFIYLLLNNAEIREVIDTITSKVVLILGRFTPERKAVLDALREELRKHNYSPVLFDFEKPASRDLTETVSTLAHLARFIIVDLTDPSSAPHEVVTVIPQTVVPVQPLLSREPLMVDGKVVERHAYSMFKDLQRRYHWVLPTYVYTDQAHLLATLQEHVVAPAEQKAQELAKR